MAIIGTYMIIDCEHCGTKYGATPDKLTKKEVRFKCKRCSNIVTAVRPHDWSAPDSSGTASLPKSSGLLESPSLPDWVREVGDEVDNTLDDFALSNDFPPSNDFDLPVSELSAYSDLTTEPDPDPLFAEPDAPSPKPVRSTGASKVKFGLTGKFVLFTILPLILISLAVVYISDDRMRKLQRETITDSTAVVRFISENLIKQISETVARQTRQYLFSHPDLRKEDFNRDIYFKKVVLQKIGITGATSLYEVTSDNGAWLTWADVDPKMVGVDMRQMEAKLGRHFKDYWNIITGVQRGIVTRGVYQWPDEKGQLRDKFMVCTPVEGTPYVISASIFMDEVTAPLKRIEAKGAMISQQIRQTLIVILGGGLLLIFIILLLYGRTLTNKIRRLAGWADAISLGDLEYEGVEIKSNDEIRELGEAITRMQDSIRLSLQRLRKRRR
jgi:predicted Zn finger-like uncharacterized protein